MSKTHPLSTTTKTKRPTSRANGTKDGFEGEITGLTPLAAIWQEMNPYPGESMLRTLIRQMTDAVVLIDRETRILEASEPAMSRLGVPLDGRLSTMKFGEVRDESGNLIEAADAIYFRCLRGEAVENMLHEFVRSDRQSRYFIINATPIRDSSGKVNMALLVAREITDIKKLQYHTEKMLTEMSRQRASLKHLINNLPASVILLDSELRVLGANKAYADYFGRPTRWRIGAKLAELLPMAEESGVLAMLMKTLESKRPVRVREFRYDGFQRGPTYWTGSAVPIELPMEDGPIAAVAMVSVDMTTEFKAKERLVELAALAERRADEIEAEKARLTTIIESTPVPLFVYDTERRVVAKNRAAEKLMKSIGKKGGVFSVADMGAEDGLFMHTASGELIGPGQGPYVRSLRGEVVTDLIVDCRSGTTGPRRMLSLNSAPLKDAKGKITGVVEAILDMTDNMRAQEQIREVYMREHAIAEKLQSCFLPTDLPEVEGFAIAERYRPALDEALVGGDFYDIFRLSETQYGIVMGDVAGKGLKAAVYTAMTKYMLRAYALEESAPELVLARLNEALAACTPTEVFVTLVYAVLDCAENAFTYANAGHEQPLYFNRRQNIVTTLDVTGRALALAKGSSYTTHTVEMLSSDTLVLYTDGITDAGWGVNRLGQEHLVELLRAGITNPVNELADTVLHHAMEFAGGKLCDDAALLIVRAEGRE